MHVLNDLHQVHLKNVYIYTSGSRFSKLLSMQSVLYPLEIN